VQLSTVFDKPAGIIFLVKFIILKSRTYTKSRFWTAPANSSIELINIKACTVIPDIIAMLIEMRFVTKAEEILGIVRCIYVSFCNNIAFT